MASGGAGMSCVALFVSDPNCGPMVAESDSPPPSIPFRVVTPLQATNPKVDETKNRIKKGFIKKLEAKNGVSIPASELREEQKT